MAQATPLHTIIPTAGDIMEPIGASLRPGSSIFEGVQSLVASRISEAAVLDEDGALVGTCSDHDLLRVLAAGEFYSDDHREEGHVADCMVRGVDVVEPDQEIYALAHHFLTHDARTVFVVREGELLGRVSRRDVLAAMERLGARRGTRKRYPDYREPHEDLASPRGTPH